MYDEIEKLKIDSIKLEYLIEKDKSNGSELKEKLQELNEQLLKKEQWYNKLTAPPKP